MCYQRLSVNNNNHNHLDSKPTHLPPLHYPHGHRWNEPYFDLTMPKNITSLVGKSAYLGCRVKHLGNKTVAWIRHRDLHILTVGTYTYTTDQRFQTSYHRDIDEWTLQIKWAQQRDAGVYECQISTQPVRSYSVNLNIVDIIDSEKNDLLQQFYNDDSFYISSDRIYQSNDDEFAGMFGPIQTVAVPTATILGGPDLYVDKGSTINLTCVIKFSPEPPTHIFWYHQDKVLSEESSGGRLKFKTIKSEETKSVLLIDEADMLDSGKYSCYPSNTETASIRVHVLQGERPEAMQTNSAPATIYKTALLQTPSKGKLLSLIVSVFLVWQLTTTTLSCLCAMLYSGNICGKSLKSRSQYNAPAVMAPLEPSPHITEAGKRQRNHTKSNFVDHQNARQVTR
ncbi:zwei Ig domain protein zig-8 [Teleopsis dalmanni]|uniref:zwei Ig domain protein zig-8 n=1 Tax=Teleopsis dalmanni TaxID=139649 RepID=UPI0018CF7B4A|nr:zwei Ig domain protein zig-8 [Teleopsis dalmanni]